MYDWKFYETKEDGSFEWPGTKEVLGPWGLITTVPVKFKMPTKRELCWRCNGDGHHSNPAIDGNGISSDEWRNEWDEESRHAYMSGRYDVRCEKCDGKCWVLAPDTEAADPVAFEDWVKWHEELDVMEREHAAEIRAGC